MMRVIINDQYVVDITLELKATIHSVKSGKRLACSVKGNAEFTRNSKRRKAVHYAMRPRDVQTNGAEIHAVVENLKFGGKFFFENRNCLEICICGQTVSHDTTLDLG